MNEEAIRSWVEEELKTNQDVIEDLNGEQIHELITDNSFVMVYLCKQYVHGWQHLRDMKQNCFIRRAS
jgi:hypothetical protein